MYCDPNLSPTPTPTHNQNLNYQWHYLIGGKCNGVCNVCQNIRNYQSLFGDTQNRKIGIYETLLDRHEYIVCMWHSPKKDFISHYYIWLDLRRHRPE